MDFLTLIIAIALTPPPTWTLTSQTGMNTSAPQINNLIQQPYTGPGLVVTYTTGSMARWMSV
ncbi:hypothetical protein EON81_12465 [bacterium]|nr:MAG: hypothetical protein EON81_12465 [bacterium]